MIALLHIYAENSLEKPMLPFQKFLYLLRGIFIYGRFASYKEAIKKGIKVEVWVNIPINH